MKIWKPGVFHGGRLDRQFFEGWYFKLISADQQQRWAIIPGVFHHPDPSLRHAFIQVLDGMTSQVTYHRFPVSDFQASGKDFEVRIQDNYFNEMGVKLNLTDQGQRIQGDVHFGELAAWPIKALSPGVMGPFRFAPFMQTYHGVLSLDHELEGSLLIDGRLVDFTAGRGYLEKDWGMTFPRAYIWMQSNHFPEQGLSLTASVATIPWLTSWFRGFLAGLLIEGKLYRFTTYLGSSITSLTLDDEHLSWSLRGTRRSDPEGLHPAYQLLIRANKSTGGLLSSPELDGMTPRILESLTASLEVDLRGMDQRGEFTKLIYQGTGFSGGLEIAGSVHEISDQTQEPE